MALNPKALANRGALWLRCFLLDRGPAWAEEKTVPLAAIRPQWNVLAAGLVFLSVYVLGTLYGLFVQDGTYGICYSLFGDGADQAQYAIATVLESVCLVGFVGYAARRAGSTWRDAGLIKPASWVPLLIGLASGLAIYYLVGFSDYIVSLIGGIRPNEHPVVALVTEAQTWKQLILPLILAGLVVPVGEEVFFRGFTYPALRNRIGVWPAIIVTGLVFSLLHFDLFGALALAVAGTALTFLYEKTGSLWACIIAHGVWNVLVALAVYVAGLS